jgi:hypothetical protein
MTVNSAIAGLPITRANEQQKFINMLIYGQSGIGKTMLAGSADAVPELRRVLFLDIEGGTLTLNNSPYNEVEVVRVRTWLEIAHIYNELYLNKHGFKTIVIDSLTELQKISMEHIVSAETSYEPTDATNSLVNVTGVPQLQDWNINIEQVRKFVRKFRDLPVNTIFTALVNTEKDQRTGLTKNKPSLSGKVKDEVAAFLDIVAYYNIKEVGDQSVRVLQTSSTETTIAKDRLSKLPSIIEDPTMAKIYEYLNTTEEQPLNV